MDTIRNCSIIVVEPSQIWSYILGIFFVLSGWKSFLIFLSLNIANTYYGVADVAAVSFGQFENTGLVTLVATSMNLT